MRDIKLDDIVNEENENLAKPGTKRDFDLIRRVEKIRIVSNRDRFFTRNFLVGNRLGFDEIHVVKPEFTVSVTKTDSLPPSGNGIHVDFSGPQDVDTKADDLKKKRQANLAKAREARKKKKEISSV